MIEKPSSVDMDIYRQRLGAAGEESRQWSDAAVGSLLDEVERLRGLHALALRKLSEENDAACVDLLAGIDLLALDCNVEHERSEAAEKALADDKADWKRDADAAGRFAKDAIRRATDSAYALGEAVRILRREHVAGRAVLSATETARLGADFASPSEEPMGRGLSFAAREKAGRESYEAACEKAEAAGGMRLPAWNELLDRERAHWRERGTLGFDNQRPVTRSGIAEIAVEIRKEGIPALDVLADVLDRVATKKDD